MSIFQAIILGVVQGLTELLPISSSAHLNLFPWIFGWGEIGASFDVALHIGTLFAIVIFFFKDWLKLIIGGYKQVIKKEKSLERENILVHSHINYSNRNIMFNFRQNIRENNRKTCNKF